MYTAVLMFGMHKAPRCILVFGIFSDSIWDDNVKRAVSLSYQNCLSLDQCIQCTLVTAPDLDANHLVSIIEARTITILAPVCANIRNRPWNVHFDLIANGLTPRNCTRSCRCANGRDAHFFCPIV